MLRLSPLQAAFNAKTQKLAVHSLDVPEEEKAVFRPASILKSLFLKKHAFYGTSPWHKEPTAFGGAKMCDGEARPASCHGAEVKLVS